MLDNKRNSFNVIDKYLYAQGNDAENDSDIIDFYSNGFKMRHSLGQSNENSYGYIFWCFGQALVGSNNIPTTAR